MLYLRKLFQIELKDIFICNTNWIDFIKNMTDILLQSEQIQMLFQTLKTRFEHNMHRHPDLTWNTVMTKLQTSYSKIRSLYEMEKTGGEPDVVQISTDSDDIIFIDCSIESPSGRRSLCYDEQALHSRKEFKPTGSVVEEAIRMGVDLLDENMYGVLQRVGEFDTKTSSWILTPPEFRKLGGALFAEYRYKKIFIYHNGAQSYYAARGFRAYVKV